MTINHYGARNVHTVMHWVRENFQSPQDVKVSHCIGGGGWTVCLWRVCAYVCGCVRVC